MPRLHRLLASVTVLTLLVIVASAQQPAASRKTVSGTVTKADERNGILHFDPVENGRKGAPDLANLARNCTVTLDGKRVKLGELLPGYAVTIEMDANVAVAVAAESFDGKAAKKKAEHDRDLAEEKIKKENNKVLVAAMTRRAEEARAAREAKGRDQRLIAVWRGATEIRAAWEARAQAYAVQNMPAAKRWKPQTPWTTTQWREAGQWAQQQPSFNKADSDLALVAFFGAVLSEGFARVGDAKGELITGVFWRYVRDIGVEEVLTRTIPGAPAVLRRAAVRLIGQLLTGNLSLLHFTIQTVIEETLEVLTAEGAGPEWALELVGIAYELLRPKGR